MRLIRIILLFSSDVDELNVRPIIQIDWLCFNSLVNITLINSFWQLHGIDFHISIRIDYSIEYIWFK